MSPKFFTLPPIEVSWPYILLNANRPNLGYVVKHRRNIKSVIIDSGIEIFRNPCIKDYSGGFKSQAHRLYLLYRRVKNVLPSAEIYVTVPDYCDDYNPCSLWLSDKVTNIERTVESIMYATEKYSDVEWLIPIQGHWRKPKTLVKCLNMLREHGFEFEKHDYYAVANLCVEVDMSVLRHSVLYVWGWFMEKLGYVPRLHVFGPKIRALPFIKNYIYSFDSMAWTRPVNSKLHSRFPFSAKTEEQRILFFKEYVRYLREKRIIEDET